MKNIYIINGTMGVGKTTVCQGLKRKLDNAVFLDGDWCWDSSPFEVTEETKLMVVDNITYLLNNFIRCTVYENIIFCWIMHEQNIIDDVINKLNLDNCKVKIISLVCDEEVLKKRLLKDVENGIRKIDVVERSLKRIPLYKKLNTIKIDTTNMGINEIIKEIGKI